MKMIVKHARICVRLMFFLLLVIQAGFLHAKLTVRMDEKKIPEGQAFNLILSSEDDQSVGVPDLTPLQKDFTITGSQSSINYTVINGQAHSENQWIILLTPKRRGILVIPPLQVGSETTSPLTIEVTKTRPGSVTSVAPVEGKQQGVFMTADVSEKNPFVNQKVLYTVKFYNSRQLLDASYQPPKVSDALMIPLKSSARYETIIDGIRYAVEELRYAILPQKSGNLAIVAPQLSALVYERVPHKIKLKARTIALQVKPQPAEFKGQEWLPAARVELSEQYDKQTNTVKQGATLTRTVMLQAIGVPAQLLQPLQFDNDEHFNVYVDRPEEKNTIQEADLIGTISVKATYLFDKPGQTVIPELKLHWFNVNSGKEEIAKLPEVRIEVTAVAADKAVEPVKAAAVKSLKVPENISVGWWAAGAFALALLVTLFLWRARKPLNSQAGSKEILKALKTACLNSDVTRAQQNLILWAKWRWPNADILSVASISELVEDGTLKQQIDKLSRALYNPDKAAPWKGEALWKSVRSLRMKKSTAATSDPLPPLY